MYSKDLNNQLSKLVHGNRKTQRYRRMAKDGRNFIQGENVRHTAVDDVFGKKT